MNKCKKCNLETNSEYYIKDIKGILCPKCAKEYVKITKIRLQKRIDELDKSLEGLDLVDCKHENTISTGFIKIMNGRQMKEFKCECGKLIYREKINKKRIHGKSND